MKFDVRIMAHPKRQLRVKDFCASHDLPISCVSYDSSGSALHGAKQAYLSRFDADTTHRLVLQDDVLICKDFFNIVQTCMQTFPNAVFSYYEGQDITFADKIRPSPYIRMRGCCVCGLAVFMPKDMIDPCFTWIDENFPADYRHDDCGIGLYCLTHGISVFSTIPSIVQHELPMNSTMRGHNHANKVSATWIGENVEEIDWTDTNYNVSKRFRNPTWLKPDDPYNIKLMEKIRKVY